MLKILGIAALVLVALLAVVLVYAATRPNTFRVERSLTIQAPPEKIFAHLQDFRRWGDWSPWDRIDPAMKRTYSGAESGLGAAYAWEGNNNIGAGRMEIAESVPSTRIRIAMHFLRPMEARNTAEFTLQLDGDGTTVTWAMYGPNNYLGKLIHVFINMDRMIGGNFETGLANLKTLAER